MSLYKLLRYSGRPNIIPNPIFGKNVTDGWTFTGNGTAVWDTANRSVFGRASCKLTSGNSGTGYDQIISDSFGISASYTCVAHVYVYLLDGYSYTARLELRDNANQVLTFATADTSISGWQKLYLSYYNNDINPKTVDLRIINTGKANGDFLLPMWVDGVHVEMVPGTGPKQALGTYGGHGGAVWAGTPHNSQSLPPHPSKEILTTGLLYDFTDDLDFIFSEATGTGTIRNERRSFALVGSIEGTSVSDFNEKRERLLRYLLENNGDNVLVYTGIKTKPKLIRTKFVGGMPDGLPLGMTSVNATLNFLSEGDDAFFKSVHPIRMKELPANLPVTHNGLYGWYNGQSLFLNNTTTNPVIHDFLLVPERGKLYFGGIFTNWDGTAGLDYFASYNLNTGNWEAVGSYPGSTVYKIKPYGKDGLLVGASDGLWHWDGSAWGLFKAQLNPGTVFDFEWGTKGELYVVGNFTNWNNNANADYIVIWDENGWRALGTGANNIIYTIKRVKNRLYVGGNFTNLAGVNATRLAYIDKNENITPVNTYNQSIRALAYAESEGYIYVGGDFTNTTTKRLVAVTLDGQQFEVADLNNSVHDLAWDGTRLWVVGQFTDIPGLTDAHYIFTWHAGQAAYAPVYIEKDAANNSVIYSVNVFNEDFFLGWDIDSGEWVRERWYTLLVENEGTAPSPVKVIFTGTSNSVGGQIKQIYNNRTGARINLNIDMFPLETITLTQKPLQIVSDTRGDLTHKVLLDSSIVETGPQPENISIFANRNQVNSINAQLEITPRFVSED